MTQALEQTDTELLHSLLAWCYIHQAELARRFYDYAYAVHGQDEAAFQYAKSHRTFGTTADSKVTYAVNLILEAGAGPGVIGLFGGNDWRPGQAITVMGRHESQYRCCFEPDADKAMRFWQSRCECRDWQPDVPCKHVVVCWMLCEASRELSKGKRAIEHSNLHFD